MVVIWKTILYLGDKNRFLLDSFNLLSSPLGDDETPPLPIKIQKLFALCKLNLCNYFGREMNNFPFQQSQTIDLILPGAPGLWIKSFRDLFRPSEIKFNNRVLICGAG